LGGRAYVKRLSVFDASFHDPAAFYGLFHELAAFYGPFHDPAAFYGPFHDPAAFHADNLLHVTSNQPSRNHKTVH